MWATLNVSMCLYSIRLGISQVIRRAHTICSQNLPTLPSTIKLEKETNPFLRCTEPEIIRNIEQKFGLKIQADDELATFTALRAWRDQY